MIASYLTAMLGLAGVMLLWGAVQLAWKRSFPDATGDVDALADRMGCGGCDRIEACAQVALGTTSEEEPR